MSLPHQLSFSAFRGGTDIRYEKCHVWYWHNTSSSGGYEYFDKFNSYFIVKNYTTSIGFSVSVGVLEPLFDRVILLRKRTGESSVYEVESYSKGLDKIVDVEKVFVFDEKNSKYEIATLEKLEFVKVEEKKRGKNSPYRRENRSCGR